MVALCTIRAQNWVKRMDDGENFFLPWSWTWIDSVVLITQTHALHLPWTLQCDNQHNEHDEWEMSTDTHTHGHADTQCYPFFLISPVSVRFGCANWMGAQLIDGNCWNWIRWFGVSSESILIEWQKAMPFHCVSVSLYPCMSVVWAFDVLMIMTIIIIISPVLTREGQHLSHFFA